MSVININSDLFTFACALLNAINNSMQKATIESAVSPLPAAAQMGLRDRGKLEKLQRIKEAARQVFMERGYEAATTREIAARADVATGTVFVYAKDKRDLMLMILNDDLDSIDENVIDPGAPFLEQLDQFFRPRYAYWISVPHLTPAILQERFYLDASKEPSAQTTRFYARRATALSILTGLVRAKQESGELSSFDPPERIAALLSTIFTAELRRVASQTAAKSDDGMKLLREMLALAVRGVLPVRQG